MTPANFNARVAELRALMNEGKIAVWDYRIYPAGHAEKPDGGAFLRVLKIDFSTEPPTQTPETLWEGNAINE